MKITVTKHHLSRALRDANKAIAARTTLPITASAHLSTVDGRLRVQATDLEVHVRRDIGVKIDAEGATCIPAKLLAPLVAGLPEGTVTIETTEGRKVRITAPGHDSLLPAFDPDDFPTVGDRDLDGPRLSLDAALFAASVGRVAHAALQDYSRPVLQGIHLRGVDGSIELAAADSFRLAIDRIEAPALPKEWSDLTVPATALKTAAGLIGEEGVVDLSVNPERTSVRVSGDDWALTAMLIQGTYPNYRQLVPNELGDAITFATADMAAELGYLSALQGNGIVRLTMLPDGLRLVTRDEDLRAEAVVKAEGPPGTKIAFNFRYFRDAVEVLKPWETVALHVASHSQPGVFVPDPEDLGPGYIEVVMPMFIEWEKEG